MGPLSRCNSYGMLLLSNSPRIKMENLYTYHIQYTYILYCFLLLVFKGVFLGGGVIVFLLVFFFFAYKCMSFIYFFKCVSSLYFHPRIIFPFFLKKIGIVSLNSVDFSLVSIEPYELQSIFFKY